MTAKEEILARIKKARVESTPTRSRKVKAVASPSRSETVAQFADYAADYKARVKETTRNELASTIAEWLSGDQKILIPKDLPPQWILPSISATPDPGGAGGDLDGFEAVVTGCALAIAETGTIVLDSGFAQGRRALTLIPDHHICVVFEDQIVDSVPEAVAGLEEAVAAGRPLTWISGPSATSDIELNRVEGVHGPRKLDILIVLNKL